MDLLCKQIELNLDEGRDTISFMIRLILKGLRNFNDNGPVAINGPGRLRAMDAGDGPEYEIFLEALNTLAHHKIILFKFLRPNYIGPSRSNFKEISVFVTDRYRLERLYTELKWLGEPENKRSETPIVKNLVYYNPITGKGIVNGNPISFKKSRPKNQLKPKELFDLLFASAPNPVSRDKLTDILKIGKNAPDETDRLSEAFSNLRSRCGVDKNVISLHGSGVMQAVAVPIDKVSNFSVFPD